MFRRIKQNIKEKTGRAQKTPLPQDVEIGMENATQMRAFAEKFVKEVDALVGAWHSSGLTVQERIGEPCGVLAAKAPSGPFADSMKALHDLHNDLGRIERRNYDEIQKRIVEDEFKHFLKHESWQAIDACNLLKRKRLERDAIASELASKSTPKRQQRADAAEVEFQSGVETARAEFQKLPEQQRQHMRALKTLLGQLASHYAECHQAAKNTVELLAKYDALPKKGEN